MKIGVLVTGDTAVRAAHSLSAHPTVDSVVVIGPATSKNFPVVDTAEGCDFLVGTGKRAPAEALRHGVPLLWDGESVTEGVAVWGASHMGLTLALASREKDPRLVATAHPDAEGGSDHKARFPDPLGQLDVVDMLYDGHRLAVAASPNEFCACLAIGAGRRVTIVDDADFLDGIALAAAVDVAGPDPKSVWDDALTYLETVASMGLVMAEDL